MDNKAVRYRGVHYVVRLRTQLRTGALIISRPRNKAQSFDYDHCFHSYPSKLALVYAYRDNILEGVYDSTYKPFIWGIPGAVA